MPRRKNAQRLERGTRRLRAEEASLVGFTICHQAEERRGMQSTLATTQKPFFPPEGPVRKKFLLRAAKVRQTPRGGSVATAWQGVQGSIFDALFQGTRRRVVRCPSFGIEEIMKSVVARSLSLNTSVVDGRQSKGMVNIACGRFPLSLITP